MPVEMQDLWSTVSIVLVIQWVKRQRLGSAVPYNKLECHRPQFWFMTHNLLGGSWHTISWVNSIPSWMSDKTLKNASSTTSSLPTWEVDVTRSTWRPGAESHIQRQWRREVGSLKLPAIPEQLPRPPTAYPDISRKIRNKLPWIRVGFSSACSRMPSW